MGEESSDFIGILVYTVKKSLAHVPYSTPYFGFYNPILTHRPSEWLGQPTYNAVRVNNGGPKNDLKPFTNFEK